MQTDSMIQGVVTMLAPNCDLDDLKALDRVLHILNKLDIPKCTSSSIYRSRPSRNMRIYYDHADLNF